MTNAVPTVQEGRRKRKREEGLNTTHNQAKNIIRTTGTEVKLMNADIPFVL